MKSFQENYSNSNKIYLANSNLKRNMKIVMMIQIQTNRQFGDYLLMQTSFKIKKKKTVINQLVGTLSF